jgi:hypothetical protein
VPSGIERASAIPEVACANHDLCILMADYADQTAGLVCVAAANAR